MASKASAEVLPQPLEVDGRVVATDHLGYLLDPDDWDAAVANAIAAREGLSLGQEHLVVIGLVREHFARAQVVPDARTLLKGMRQRLGEERATRPYLQALFPYGYGSQVCKIAGMTMPRQMMLDV
jgi:TusE/DsrC/DsvC family sulfur relay protein